MVTRITSLEGFDNVLLGRDLKKIFKPGHVYDVSTLEGVTMITDLGKHAKPKHSEAYRIDQIATDGSYCLTEREYAIQWNKECDEMGNEDRKIKMKKEWKV